MAKSFHQQKDFHFHETFYHVVKLTTIRVILTVAIAHRWNTQQIDINNSFLNGDLHEEMYMQQPPGFGKDNPQLVFKLNKTLYGLKQAPRAWHEKMHQALIQFGFASSRCHH